jgi:serine/threonine protein phosphatase PrpC
VELCDQDEFIILGCDGIWDCLTNEKAVAYVSSRIDIMHPTQIGIDVLNEIISEDPRATQGIGGDNMTFMVIDLQPATRSWRRPGAATAAVAPEQIPSAEGSPNETG